METPVVRDTTDVSDTALLPPVHPSRSQPVEAEAAPHAWAARRFAVDPASSPHLMAAFAWNTRA